VLRHRQTLGPRYVLRSSFAGGFRTTDTADESVKCFIGVVETTQVAKVILIKWYGSEVDLKVYVNNGTSVAKVQ
jgi:hypothetical protein